MLAFHFLDTGTPPDIILYAKGQAFSTAHTSIMIRLNPETSCYDVTVYCDKCNKPLTATVKVQLPPKCMIGGDHTVKDCPLQMRGLAHKGLEV